MRYKLMKGTIIIKESENADELENAAQNFGDKYYVTDELNPPVKQDSTMNSSLEQQIGDLEAKIAKAANQSGGGADEESRIDDMICDLSTLEQKLDKEQK